MGSLVGVPNVVHTFGENVMFVNFCDDRGNGISVNNELEFILAPGYFMLRVECLLVVGESGQGDPWVLERWIDGAAAIKGVVVCDSARLVFSGNEGEEAVFYTVPFGVEGGGDLGDRLD